MLFILCPIYSKLFHSETDKNLIILILPSRHTSRAYILHISLPHHFLPPNKSSIKVNDVCSIYNKDAYIRKHKNVPLATRLSESYMRVCLT